MHGPQNYSAIRSILKKEQGEKIAPYVFKISDSKTIKKYLDEERITYEIYQEELKEKLKRELPETSQEPRKKRKVSEE